MQPDSGSKAVAFVDGVPIKAAELDDHATATGKSRDEALDDLINLQLVRAAAANKKMKTPSGSWSEEERAGIELALARALSLDIPQGNVSLVVDHAWLKDADDEAARTAGRELMERLRGLVEAGTAIPLAYEQLHADGSLWHIGDHEEYPYDVVPDEARDLPAGSLSAMIPGDGGLHLFKVYQRKEELPSRTEIHDLLMDQLRIDATIDLVDETDEMDE